MGAKYIVFVDELLVTGAAQMAAANAGFGSPAQPGTPSLREDLGLRRAALNNLAASLVGPGGAAAALTANSAAATLNEAAQGAAPAGDTPNVQILEGVSAVVVDGDDVDINALANVIGLTVVPNVQLLLPTPVAVGTATALDTWHLKKIGLASGQAGGNGILIGVLDTGIDAAHAEFAGKNVHFAEFSPAGIRLPNKARDAGDHGTHVSSIAAGARAGVAPNADLAVAAVLTTPTPLGMSGSLLQIINGFNWLVTNPFRAGAAPGVDVVNASLGGSGFNTYLRSSIQTAFTLGVPFIAAIGNDGRGGVGRHGSPGNYPESLGIGASDPTDTVADFSDWGVSAPPTGPKYPVPDFCAPGVDVHAAKPGGGFQLMSGTSMATPVVTGIAARRMAANPALKGKPAALFASLRSSLAPCASNPLGNLGGAGRIIA